MKKFNGGFSIIIFVMIFILIASAADAQQKSKKKAAGKKESASETVIATVGNEKITYHDLEKAFKKNMNRKDANFFDVAKDSIYDFLNLYLNYRLKVNDALGRSFDKDSSVLADINQNRRVLAESFFYEKKLVDPKVDQMLKLRDRELQFAFILFKFPPFPTSDTMRTYKKAKACLDLLKSGRDFKALAADSSEDKETATKGGVVANYVTSGKIQRSIEQALYSLKPNDVYPDLVRFRDGYLILKLLHSEPRLRIKARHILLSEGLDKDTAKVVRKADSLIALLKKGADFKKLAEENSDDPSSAVRGGDLGAWYSRSSGMDGSGKSLLPPFEEAMFKLKEGQISDKVFTDYGLHIIRRDSTKPFDPALDQDELKKLYKRVYYESDKREFLDSLQKAFGFVFNRESFKAFVACLDTTKTNLDTNWTKKITNEIKSKELYKFNGKSHSVDEFINTMNKKSELRGFSLNNEGLNRAINKLIDPETFDLATKNLENEFSEFAALMREFRDGILLFKVEAQEVWDKLKFDSTLARAYYDTTKSKYNTIPAYDISEIYVVSDSLAKDIYKKALNGDKFDILAENFTQRAGYREKKGLWGRVTIKDNDFAKICFEKKAKAGTILEPVPFEKGFSIIKVNNYEPSRQKVFEESISDFAPDFQELTQKNLIDKWLKQVRTKYPVVIQNEVLDQTLNDLKKSSKK